MNGLSVGSNTQYDIPIVFSSSGGLSGYKARAAGVIDIIVRQVRCPLCRKRLFDISVGIVKDMGIEIKCPHCQRIITLIIGGVTH